MPLSMTGSILAIVQSHLSTRALQQKKLRKPGINYGTVSAGCILPCLPAYSSDCLIDGAFNVPLEKLTALNKSSLDGDFRLVGSEHGGGVAGLLEGFHQIHCLVRYSLSSGLARIL